MNATMKHTPEPWNLHEAYKGEIHTVTDAPEPWDFASRKIAKGEMIIGDIEFATPTLSMGFPRVKNHDEMTANAERIILCVNALAGLTEAQIKGINFAETIEAQAAKL
jgi:hypothetical protein